MEIDKNWPVKGTTECIGSNIYIELGLGNNYRVIQDRKTNGNKNDRKRKAKEENWLSGAHTGTGGGKQTFFDV